MVLTQKAFCLCLISGERYIQSLWRPRRNFYHAIGTGWLIFGSLTNFTWHFDTVGQQGMITITNIHFFSTSSVIAKWRNRHFCWRSTAADLVLKAKYCLNEKYRLSVFFTETFQLIWSSKSYVPLCVRTIYQTWTIVLDRHGEPYSRVGIIHRYTTLQL